MSQNQPKGIFNIEARGKMPPNELALEEAMLGAMMLEKDGLVIGMSSINNKDIFYKESHQHIFTAIQMLFAEGNPVDILTVTAKLRSMGSLEIAGGPYYITELTTKVNSAANIEYHLRLIKQAWIKRLIIQVSSRNQQLAYDDTVDEFYLLEKTALEFLKLQQQLSIKQVDTGKEIYKQSTANLARAMLTPGMTGISTGIPELDKVTGGWQSPDLVIIAGRPGMGKTAFVISTTKQIFLQEKKYVLVFSLEMTSVQLMDRLIAGESGFSGTQLKKGHITETQYGEILQKTQHLYTDFLIVDDTPAITIGQLRAKAVAEKIKHPDLACIVVDYLQLMKGSNPKNQNKEQEISEISAALKALAKELGIPVIALAQLSRAVETRGGDKKPQLSDLRESGAIEQDADVVMFVYRAEYYKIETYEDGSSTVGRAEIIYAKNRHGPPAEVTIGFRGAQYLFHTLEEPLGFTKLPDPPVLFPVANTSQEQLYKFDNPDAEFEDDKEPF